MVGFCVMYAVGSQNGKPNSSLASRRKYAADAGNYDRIACTEGMGVTCVVNPFGCRADRWQIEDGDFRWQRSASVFAL